MLFWAGDCRDAEEELATVADERDALRPQVEEVKWQARQAEKRVSTVETELTSAQQVRQCLRKHDSAVDWQTDGHM